MNDQHAELYPAPPNRKTSLRRIVLIVLRTVAIGYAAVCVFMYFYQYRLIYIPSKQLDSDPSAFGMTFTDVLMTADDAVHIAGWYVEPDRPQGALILCHGNAGNMSHRLDLANAFYRADVAVLLFDYRGYGTSEGSPDEAGTYADAEAAWKYLTEIKAWPPERILIYGESIGGAVAIELAVRYAPGGLIAESTFTTLYDLARSIYPFLPVKLLARARYESIRKISGVACPKLFIHSKDDELVPYHHGRALFEAAEPPKYFLETHGGHNDGGFLIDPGYLDRVLRFIDEVLTSSDSKVDRFSGRTKPRSDTVRQLKPP